MESRESKQEPLAEAWVAGKKARAKKAPPSGPPSEFRPEDYRIPEKERKIATSEIVREVNGEKHLIELTYEEISPGWWQKLEEEKDLGEIVAEEE